MIGLFFQWFKQNIKTLVPKKFSVEGTAGTGAPYYTGLVLGGYEALAGFFNLRERIRFTPDFEQAVFTVKLNASGYISLAGALRPTIRLCMKKPVRRVIKGYMKNNI
jgi:hypothetical protein